MRIIQFSTEALNVQCQSSVWCRRWLSSVTVVRCMALYKRNGYESVLLKLFFFLFHFMFSRIRGWLARKPIYHIATHIYCPPNEQNECDREKQRIRNRDVERLKIHQKWHTEKYIDRILICIVSSSLMRIQSVCEKIK